MDNINKTAAEVRSDSIGVPVDLTLYLLLFNNLFHMNVSVGLVKDYIIVNKYWEM